MFSGMRNFLSRHRRKFVVTGVLMAGGVFAVRYAHRKLLDYQEAKTREFFEQKRRTQHFSTTERTCNQAITGLAPDLIEQINKVLDTDTILDEIKQNPERKIELWNELKVLAFSRLTALVYASSMLVIVLRIQFNILGGYLYKDTASGDEKVNADIQKHYVALIQYFLRDGIDAMCALIKRKVRQVLSGYDLSQKLTLAETEQIFWSIQMAVNSDGEDPSSRMAKYVFPTDVSEYTAHELFTTMFSETIDMLESDDVSALNSNNVSRGFSIVVDHIADFYMKPENGMQPNGVTNVDNNNGDAASIHPTTSKAALNGIAPSRLCNGHGDDDDGRATITELPNINSITIPLPKLIPFVNGLAKQQFNSTAKPPGLSTSLLTLFLISDKVKILGANVYEAFVN